MYGSRIKIIDEGHLFVIFLFSFTNKLNTLSLSSVGNFNKLRPIIIVISVTEDVHTDVAELRK